MYIVISYCTHKKKGKASGQDVHPRAACPSILRNIESCRNDTYFSQ
jgi:hypothetical protein